jgi:hypothetical protein
MDVKLWMLAARQQLLTLLGVLASLFKTSVELRLENLALRNQLDVLRRSAPKRVKLILPIGSFGFCYAVSGRPDVLTFKTDMLTAPVKISGEPVANMVASTTGYQLAISMDIFRGRYRESLSQPRAVTPDTPQLYRFALPAVNHVFMPGHRIMVQVQSSWFPLYDRNPQTFVPNIFFANAANYKKATQRIYHAPGHASFVELPLVTPER